MVLRELEKMVVSLRLYSSINSRALMIAVDSTLKIEQDERSLKLSSRFRQITATPTPSELLEASVNIFTLEMMNSMQILYFVYRSRSKVFFVWSNIGVGLNEVFLWRCKWVGSWCNTGEAEVIFKKKFR